MNQIAVVCLLAWCVMETPFNWSYQG